MIFTGHNFVLAAKAQAPQRFPCGSYLDFLRMNLFVAAAT
jgi:hypothetical protein